MRGWEELGADGQLWAEVLCWIEARLKGEDDGDARGLLAWGREYLAEHFQRPPSRMHAWLADELDGMRTRRGTRLNLVGPRGGAKSTVATLAYVLREALEGREAYVWIVSGTRQQAVTHLEHVASELRRNLRLREVYGWALGARGFGERLRVRQGRVALANGAVIEAFGSGQQIRGRRFGRHRPTLIVCDDVQGDVERASKWRREQSKRWFHGTLMQSGTAKTNVVHLGTALRRDCLAVELNQTPGWRGGVFRAIESWPARMELWEAWEEIYANVEDRERETHAREFFEQKREAMEEGARVLWPEAEDLYGLMCLRAEGGRGAFEREKQANPLDEEECEWPAEYFAGSVWFTEWPRDVQIKTIAIDPSKGRSDRRGDYSAIVRLAIDESGVMYVEADLKRRPTPELVADGVESYRTFRPDAMGVEANHFQELLGLEFEAEFRRRGVLGARPWSIDNRVNKRVRIRRLGPHLATRRMRFKQYSPGTRMLVEQLRTFPVGDHDDGPDALEMAVRLAEELLESGTQNDGLGDRLRLSE
jgi:predicted phage terminase large subunit-like protein